MVRKVALLVLVSSAWSTGWFLPFTKSSSDTQHGDKYVDLLILMTYLRVK